MEISGLKSSILLNIRRQTGVGMRMALRLTCSKYQGA
ncbi:uncharacterized protein OCT59_026864 [Rhizophagus irregularis]|nr:hypothetical protein OCT59_026864 [Rhizophagus irregularis]